MHKSARSADAKTKLMPIVAPCVGVVDGSWAKTYLELRKNSGLDMPSSDAIHMLPAPADSSGTFWHGRYLTSEEGSEFLHAIGCAEKEGSQNQFAFAEIHDDLLDKQVWHSNGVKGSPCSSYHSSAESHCAVFQRFTDSGFERVCGYACSNSFGWIFT